MEYKNFKQAINKMGLETTIDENCICIFNDNLICSISEKIVGVLSTEYENFYSLPVSIRKQLINTVYLYATTDLDSRHIKRFCLQHKYLTNSAGHAFLNVSEDYKRFSLGTNREYKNKRNKVFFTGDELDILKFKLNTTLDDFAIIEQKETTKGTKKIC